MALLTTGLALFFIVHIVPALPSVRAGLIERLGAGPYRGLFSLASIAGLVAIVLGYGQMQGLARSNPELWTPPAWIKHVVLLLMIPAMVLLVAAYVPSRIRSAVRHPMLTALMIWAFAHLL
ncbi:MAG: NnrU family protein, partial [Hyphomicrobiaceae bacterium]